MGMRLTGLDHTNIVTALAIEARPDVYVELGVAEGYTINKVVDYVGKAIGVDSDNNSKLLLNKKIEFYNMTTDNFFEAMKNSLKIDMLFIDANHDYDQALKDFINFSSIVNENGLIMMHDTFPIDERHIIKGRCSDSWRVAVYIRKNFNKDFEIMTIPIHPGISIIRKANKQLIWRMDE